LQRTVQAVRATTASPRSNFFIELGLIERLEIVGELFEIPLVPRLVQEREVDRAAGAGDLWVVLRRGV
jgi:hypothetical protein